MKLILVLLSTIATVLLLPPSSCQHHHHTHYEHIHIRSPVAWYPAMADLVVRYYTHVTCNLIDVYKVIRNRLEAQRNLLLQFPQFYGSISLFYDGDHLRPFMHGHGHGHEHHHGHEHGHHPGHIGQQQQQGRILNYTVPQPEVAHDVVDTVKALMNGLKNVKN